jgi:hypothetical protein
LISSIVCGLLWWNPTLFPELPVQWLEFSEFLLYSYGGFSVTHIRYSVKYV